MTATKDWKRARRPKQKEERSAAILRAATTLLDAEGINGTGMNAVARAAGLSKANLYRYSESLEAMLLELMPLEQGESAAEFPELAPMKLDFEDTVNTQLRALLTLQMATSYGSSAATEQ